MRHSTRAAESDNDSDSGSDVSDVFSDDGNDNSSDSGSETNSGDDGSDDSDTDSIIDDGEAQEFSAEHYLQEAECFDVSRLRQKRYSPRTQEKLDKAREYWEWYEIFT